MPIHKTYSSLSEGADIPEARLRQILTRLKERDFRITPQRLAILKILAASNGHPSVDKIFDQVKLDFPTTSLATVYKTVTLLKELGEVLELGFPDGSNRYDGNKPYPHPHMVCLKCKRISDPDLQSVEELTREAEQKTGFDILSHRLDFFGICPDCRQGD
ncbi:MAG: transcriptional repressor [Desulfobacterota bacterium]|nr:transcriptional repressor [Thermodesulfobacteriota bacterium]